MWCGWATIVGLSGSPGGAGLPAAASSSRLRLSRSPNAAMIAAAMRPSPAGALVSPHDYHVQKQLELLYGPLAFLIYEGRQAFDDLWEKLWA